MSLKNIEKQYDEELLPSLERCWGYLKYGSYWEHYGSSPQYEEKLKKEEIIREHSDEEMTIVVSEIVKSYKLILVMSDKIKDIDSKFRSKVFKLAISMSEEMQMFKNAYNLARVAVNTAHGRKFFRAAIERNKNKKPLPRIEKNISINLNEITKWT